MTAARCAWCRHSIGSLHGLWCELRGEFPIGVCRRYEREPGADDE